MSRQQRDLRAITRDGVFFSIMVGVGETYVPAFAIAIGLGDITAGLIATVPVLLGSLLQLVTPLAVRWLGSYRRWVVTCAVCQALSFLPLILGAVMGRVGLPVLVASCVSYWAFGLSAGPAWNAWVTTLVPPELRTRFFARRSRAAHAAILLGLLAGGAALELGRRGQVEVLVFALLFTTAMVSRLISSRCLAAQSEGAGITGSLRVLGPGPVWGRLRDAGSLRVLRYLLAMQVVTQIAAPYFTPFLLSHRGMGYGEFMTLTAASFVSRVAVLPLLARIASNRGSRRLLWLGGLGIAPLPLLWLVSDAFVYLLVIQLLAGLAWAAVEFATTLSFFEGIEEEDRTAVLTAFNFANAVSMALGALIGAWLMSGLASSGSVYAWVFAVSALGRLGAAAMLGATPAPSVPALGGELRTLGVRPAGPAIQRPVLPSLDVPHPAPSDPSEQAEGEPPRG